MIWLVAILCAGIAGIVLLGLSLALGGERLPGLVRHRRTLAAGNLLLFVAGLGGLLLFATNAAVAQVATAAPREISLGLGLALIGIGLPTGMACIGAALALGPIGSSALAVVAERPEAFGRTLVYLGLAEGVAIYGLVVSILMLEKL
ncbi:MAG: ATP synthase subunit C [Rhodocyclaceae bacterium]|nr:ATP synthase subunit C [Rhodocyclaceae bacterium]